MTRGALFFGMVLEIEKVAFFGEGFGEELGGDRKEGKAFLHGNYSS